MYHVDLECWLSNQMLHSGKMMNIIHECSFAVKGQNEAIVLRGVPPGAQVIYFIWKINGSSVCSASYLQHQAASAVFKYIHAHTLCIWRIWKHSIVNPSPYVTLHWVCVTAECRVVASDLKANLRLYLYWLMFTIGFWLPVCGRLNLRDCTPKAAPRTHLSSLMPACTVGCFTSDAVLNLW